jgi:glyceraldehyde-3-phosphate dehydrogenase (NAD(P))
MANILVIGTGTIGEPLIGLLADFKKKLNISEVMFHKRTPLSDEISKVKSLVKRGAKLVVNKDKFEDFQKLGHKPQYNFDKAFKKADVVIDCTPAGNIHKEKHYTTEITKKKKIFIAQGSEKGFGIPYAYGINDTALRETSSQFVQVVSCNTHNISCILRTIAPNHLDLVSGDFVCIRRSNDISQDSSFLPSPQVGKHNDRVFGTHHARDAFDLFMTMYKPLRIHSSAMKVNSQYMHIIRFDLQVKGSVTKEDVIRNLKENKFIALTEKTSANKVFSFGRDHGYYGRIFNQTVVSTPSLAVVSKGGTTRITGFCFTPQDGNSLLSSVAAATYAIHGDDYIKKMRVFDDFLFEEI